jgi:hypothetical protein
MKSAWIPAHIRVEDGETLMEWTCPTLEDLREPFVGQDAENAPQIRRSAPLRELVEPERRPRLGRLDAIVFQISRCGSTLVANAFGTAAATVVFKEPQSVSGLFKLPARLLSPAQREPALRGVFDAFERYAESAGVRYAIKFESWNVLHARTLRAALPDVPVLVLVRDPLEVAVSVLRSPPGWMQFKRYPMLGELALGWPADAIAAMSGEEFVARAIGSFLRGAYEAMDDRMIVCDYSQLTAQRLISLARSLGLAPADPDAIERIMTFHAKHGPAHPFIADADRKRAAASAELCEALHEHTTVPYRALLAAARASNSSASE